MTTYLLHGGMLVTKNASNDAYFKRIADAVPEDGTILFVLFAAEEHRWPELFETMKGYVADAAQSKHITYVQASKAGFLDEVRKADVVVIRGGGTDRLLETLRAYPDLAGVFAGKLVAGSSAGAYAIATYNYARGGKKIRNGLGLYPSRVLCHFQSTDEKEYNGQEALATMESEHQELPLIVLHDCEWKEVTI